MNQYRIIDNVLSEDDLIKIEQNVLQAPIFKAFDSTATSQSDNVYDVMMSRVFFSSYYSQYQQAGFDQEYLPYFYPLLNEMVSGFLLRVSLNLTFATPSPYVSEFHVDTEVSNSLTCVYYLNSNNGGTQFKNSGEIVQSKRNRGVIFPSHLSHAAVNTTDTKLRWVLNINYVPN